MTGNDPFEAFEATRTAVLLVDLQNDFLHPDGAYARGGATAPSLAAAAREMAAVAAAASQAGVATIATLFTLVPGPDGPLISDHLQALRPFLAEGDFAPGSWGQQPLDEISASTDVTVEKVAYSAFHQSRLQFVLEKLGVEALLVGGIVTNGGVASTVRHAHVLGLETVVLTDGCGAFSSDAHDAAIGSLATIGPVSTCADAVRWLSRAVT